MNPAQIALVLIDTLQKGLGDDFTSDVKQAWTTAYGLLSTVMIEASTERA